jgi:hypothetical protein
MKTRDLFAGCSVMITPHDDVWLVTLYTDDLKSVSMRTYHELPDAIEAVHETRRTCTTSCGPGSSER